MKFPVPAPGVSPPAWAFVAANFGSLPAIEVWMFSETERPCCFVQFRNPCGSGNSAGFQFQPFHCDGDFQSVSTTSQS